MKYGRAEKAVKNGKGCEEWEGWEEWGRYELQARVGGVVVALNYS